MKVLKLNKKLETRKSINIIYEIENYSCNNKIIMIIKFTIFCRCELNKIITFLLNPKQCPFKFKIYLSDQMFQFSH